MDVDGTATLTSKPAAICAAAALLDHFGFGPSMHNKLRLLPVDLLAFLRLDPSALAALTVFPTHGTRAACCVLHAACCVLRAACCVLCAACCVLRAACCA